MEERRRFIQNIPYLTDISDYDIISEIAYLMKEETFSMKQIILKKQALNDSIMILWEGAVVVEVCRTDPSTLDR